MRASDSSYGFGLSCFLLLFCHHASAVLYPYSIAHALSSPLSPPAHPSSYLSPQSIRSFALATTALKSALFACHFTCCKSKKKINLVAYSSQPHRSWRFFFCRRPNTGRLRPDRILLFPFHSRLASLLLILLMQTSCPPAYLLTLFLGKTQSSVQRKKRIRMRFLYGMLFSAMKSQIDI